VTAPLTFAVGDIHGQLEPLKTVVSKCFEYAGNSERLKFVFVGDYIDRGPDSRGVIDFLIELSSMADCVFLRGNHEDMFLYDWNSFLHNGGFNTLRSYGWHDDHSIAPYAQARVIEHFIPKEHMDFFRATKIYHQDGMRNYVHAGILRHHGHMENQSERVMLWVRHEFLEDPSEEGGYVVHGHTPMENGVLPASKPNRVNLDTGSVFGGRLTAGVFDDETPAMINFIQDQQDVDGRIGEKIGGVYIPHELIKKAESDDV
jgi:calcineurin-like phosphoesterase family protein